MSDALLKKLVHWGMSAIATTVIGWLVTKNDPFYHPGWAQQYFGWLLLAVVVALVAVLLSLSIRGLIVIGLLAFICAAGFGFLYAGESFQESYWPLVAWLLHVLVAALLVGVIAGLVSQFALWIRHTR